LLHHSPYSIPLPFPMPCPKETPCHNTPSSKHRISSNKVHCLAAFELLSTTVTPYPMVCWFDFASWHPVLMHHKTMLHEHSLMFLIIWDIKVCFLDDFFIIIPLSNSLVYTKCDVNQNGNLKWMLMHGLNFSLHFKIIIICKIYMRQD
jgi:hypothetical protein